jgi:cbb3-type cytochrome oxidase subunit 3
MNGAKVSFEDWHALIQGVAFVIIFLAFCYFTFRTMMMKKEKERAMAAMALDDTEGEGGKPDGMD